MNCYHHTVASLCACDHAVGFLPVYDHITSSAEGEAARIGSQAEQGRMCVSRQEWNGVGGLQSPTQGLGVQLSGVLEAELNPEE